MVQLVQIVQAVRKVQTRLGYIVLSAVILVFSTPGAGQMALFRTTKVA
jgi:hypothetical protein